MSKILKTYSEIHDALRSYCQREKLSFIEKDLDDAEIIATRIKDTIILNTNCVNFSQEVSV